MRDPGRDGGAGGEVTDRSRTDVARLSRSLGAIGVSLRVRMVGSLVDEDSVRLASRRTPMTAAVPFVRGGAGSAYSAGWALVAVVVITLRSIAAALSGLNPNECAVAA
jgi:hypothetical protein